MSDITIPATEIEIAEALNDDTKLPVGVIRRLAFERDRLKEGPARRSLAVGKPLVWTPFHGRDEEACRAETPLGRYLIHEAHYGKERWAFCLPSKTPQYANSLDAAKAVCQEHWQSTIARLLAPVEVPDVEAMAKEIAEYVGVYGGGGIAAIADIIRKHLKGT